MLLVKGKAETVERNCKQLHKDWSMPTVIRLRYFVSIPHKEIPLTRRNVMHRDHYTCQYCDRRSDLTIDHVIPRSRGGQDAWDNVVVACLRCNVTKGSRTPKEMGFRLKGKPKRPVNFIQFELSKQHHLENHDYEHWEKYLEGFIETSLIEDMLDLDDLDQAS